MKCSVSDVQSVYLFKMADRTLSDFEISYIKQGVLEDMRSDGRSCRDYRSFQLRSGTVSNTSGSAEIKLVGVS